MKKIAVCHGKNCGPAGAARIFEKLKKAYVPKGVDVVVRECCGRCERCNSIEIDGTVIISDLSPEKIEEQFIADPTRAIERAKREAIEASKKLDDVLADDLV